MFDMVKENLAELDEPVKNEGQQKRGLSHTQLVGGVICCFFLLLLIILLTTRQNEMVSALEISDFSLIDSAVVRQPKRSSSAIAITSDGQLLVAANPDSGSISLLRLAATIQVEEIMVGTDPRTVAIDEAAGRAYVANRGDHTVSVVDIVNGLLVGKIDVGARPYGVVLSPDGAALYVSEQGADRVNIIDTTDLVSRGTIAVADRPSGLAIDGDGRRLYVSHLTRSFLTVIDLSAAKSYFPLIAGSAEPGRVVETLQYKPLPAPEKQKIIHLWPDSNLVQAIIISPDGQTAYIPHTRSNSGNKALSLDTTVFPLVSLVDLENLSHLSGQQLNLDILDAPAVGLPFDAALAPDGETIWILNAASNDISVVNLSTRQRMAHIEVGDNPRGIVISPDGQKVYVNNTLDGTISIINTSTYEIISHIPVTTIPLDPLLLQGKKLFNSSDDPRMGKDQWMSCATCHMDGENDGQTWFLGFAGPRNTSSLWGMKKTRPLRWSGEWDEAADAEFAIRMDSFGSGLIPGEMQCSLNPPDCINHPPHSGLSPDLDALAAYIDSFTVPLSPDHIREEPLSPAAERGRLLFNQPLTGCAACHAPPLYSDNLSHDVGTATADEKVSPAFNTPSLLGVYDSGPYFHHGGAQTLVQAVTTPGHQAHDMSGKLSPSEIDDLAAFLQALPFEK